MSSLVSRLRAGLMADRFNVNTSLSRNWEHVNTKFTGTGNPDMTRQCVVAAGAHAPARAQRTQPLTAPPLPPTPAAQRVCCAPPPRHQLHRAGPARHAAVRLHGGGRDVCAHALPAAGAHGLARGAAAGALPSGAAGAEGAAKDGRCRGRGRRRRRRGQVEGERGEACTGPGQPSLARSRGKEWHDARRRRIVNCRY